MTSSRIFISYSHQGDGPKWKAALLRQLQPFEQCRLLDVWQDGKIRVSSFWEDDIKQAMGSARLAIVLLTREALESEYILGTEFPFLRQRQERDKLPVLPIVCEECDWRAHDWLQATQAPNSGAPLAELSAMAQEHVFRSLAADIAYELSRMSFAELSGSEQPLQPSQLYLDSLPLVRSGCLSQEELVGREQELALLDLAFAQQDTAIASLVAWGGVGKTMLVKSWLRRLQCEGWFGAQRVYAWSFFSQGTREDRQTSEDGFLAHALQWFGVQCEPTLSPWDKGRLLADAVARERTLLILDGIEPLQYPPGPMGGRLRAPGVQTFLNQLAGKRHGSENKGLCLVTSREPLTDLADYEHCAGTAWGSVLRMNLGNLSDDAGATLLHHAGAKRAGAAEISSNDDELIAASREVDGHALTLHLLGRFLARAHGGDVRRRDLVMFAEADRGVQGGTTFKMLAAFENWFAKSGEFGSRQLAVLRILGLFDRPADSGCISALRTLPAIPGLTDPLFATAPDAVTSLLTEQPLLDEDWNTAISFLVDFGLIAIQSDVKGHEQLLDCHPLIREHFSTGLRAKAPASWELAHRRLFAHLSSTADRPNPTLEDLNPLYQAVVHGCSGGLYVDAWDMLYERILRRNASYSLFQLGAASMDLAAYALFFKQPWKEVAACLSLKWQAWIINGAAFRLQVIGRLAEAADAYAAAVAIEVSIREFRQASAALNNLSENYQLLGLLDAAARAGEDSVRYSDESKDAFEQICSRCRLAYCKFLLGKKSESDMLFRDAEARNAIRQPQFPFLTAFQGYLRCDSLLADAESSAWSLYSAAMRQAPISPYDLRRAQVLPALRVEEYADRLMQLGRRYSLSRISIALAQLTVARTLLYRYVINLPRRDQDQQEVFARARDTTTSAVEEIRRIGQPNFLPLGLLAQAWLGLLAGDIGKAQAELDEAWGIAVRGPMRLHMADIHLHRARLFGRERPYPWSSPQDDLIAARQLIEQCGYWRRKEELIDAEEAAKER